MIRRLLALLVVALAALTVGACGLPEKTSPVVVGNAPREGAVADNDTGQPLGPGGAATPQELVERFLKAAAGANEGTQDRPEPAQQAATRIRDFLTGDWHDKWQPGQNSELKIVQAAVNPAVRTSTPDVERVDVTMRPVGVLKAQGQIIPAADTNPYQVSYSVRPAAGGPGWRIADPPAEIVLSSAGLTELYEARSVYFWDRSDRYLVPDLRYLAKSTPVDQRPNELVDWLRRGPSSWLLPAVNLVPEPIQVKDRVSAPVQPGSGLQVNLSSKANGAQEQVRRFFVQLQWTLAPSTGSIDLRIEGQKVADLSVGDYVRFNPTLMSTDQEPAAYCVAGGQVRPAAGSAASSPPILSSAENSGVLRAALSRDQSIALVRADDGGLQRLWLGAWDQSDRGGAQMERTEFSARAMGRPVWLSTAGSRVLVVADGQLYDVQYAAHSGVANRVGGIDAVTAFAVAPDGRRLAFVAGGRVYVAPLVVEDRVSVGAAQEVALGLTGMVEPTALAWNREQSLVVAGRIAGRTAFVDVTVDGAAAQQLQLSNVGDLNVTDLAARPVVRRDGSNRPARVLVEANGRAWEVYSGSVGNLDPAGPTPSQQPGQSSVSTAPFFVD